MEAMDNNPQFQALGTATQNRIKNIMAQWSEQYLNANATMPPPEHAQRELESQILRWQQVQTGADMDKQVSLRMLLGLSLFLFIVINR